MKTITDQELKNALGLQPTILPSWVLDENNAPTEADGIGAAKICYEWNKYKEQSIEAETEQQARRDFPAHWICLKAEMKVDNYREGVADYLEMFYETSSFLTGFASFMFKSKGWSFFGWRYIYHVSIKNALRPIFGKSRVEQRSQIMYRFENEAFVTCSGLNLTR